MVPRQWTESPSFFTRDMNRSVARSGPPTQKLNISSQASISKNRQVSFAPLQQYKASSSRVSAEKLYTYYLYLKKWKFLIQLKSI